MVTSTPARLTLSGNSSGWRYQTRPISAKSTSPVGPTIFPSPTVTPRSSHCKRCAPIVAMRTASSVQARDTAPPAMTMLREAMVPIEYGVSAVSPWIRLTRAGSMPRISLAT